MSDDIVTRLRDYLAIVDHAFVWNELSDAADEIERLRTHTNALVLDNVELMAKIATLQAIIDGRKEDDE